jgi:tetratricopeptide (TPR) repeat protein
LTHLGRREEAIAAATRMLDLGTWHIGDAYYWRAQNHYDGRDLARAAADAAEAKKLRLNADVLTLAGMIAYDQQKHDEARTDFLEARRLRADTCIPAWYLGLIASGRGDRSSAAREFSNAATCYEATANELRKELVGLPSDLLPAERQRQSDELTQQIDASTRYAANARTLGERAEAEPR